MSSYCNKDKVALPSFLAVITVTSLVATVIPTEAATVTFREFTPPGGDRSFNLAGNEYTSQNLRLENFYRYIDGRDTNDQVGISLGPPNSGNVQTGIINFLKPVNNLSFEYWTIEGDLDIKALDANNNVLDTLNDLVGSNTVVSVSGSNIAALQVNGLIGFGQITTLNFQTVPEPTSPLCLLAFGAFCIGLRLVRKPKTHTGSIRF